MKHYILMMPIPPALFDGSVNVLHDYVKSKKMTIHLSKDILGNTLVYFMADTIEKLAEFCEEFSLEASAMEVTGTFDMVIEESTELSDNNL